MNQETTRQVAPAPTPQQQALSAAFDAARARHADFDLLQPITDTVVRALYPEGLYPDWSKIRAEEFVEILYVAAKYAYFTAEAREGVFARALGAAPTRGVM